MKAVVGNWLDRAMHAAGLVALLMAGLASLIGSSTPPGCGVDQDLVRVSIGGIASPAGEGTSPVLTAGLSVPVEESTVGSVLWERMDPTANSWVGVQSGLSRTYRLGNLVYSRDNGTRYRVTVGLRCSNADSAVINLIRTSDPITVQIAPGPVGWFEPNDPRDASVPQGTTVRFSALAYGDNAYQWQVSSDAGSTWRDVPLATADTLQVLGNDSGLQYRLTATNRTSAQTIVSRAATLTVTPVAPTITQQPADADVAIGDLATFAVTADGGALAYQWQRSDGVGAFADVPSATQSAFTLTAQGADHGARLRVRVSNSAGTVTSTAALLSVSQPGQAAITQQPTDQSVVDGGTATFSVLGSGPSLTYQWQRSDNAGAPFVDIAGANAASFGLVASAASQDDGARFRVLVGNAVNTVTSSEATLRITLLPPAITQGPVDLTVAAGGAASFSVAASGSQLRYQWQTCTAGGAFVNIADATSDTYTFTAQVADDGRRLRATVTGATGAPVSSNCATLTVNGTGLAIEASPAALVYVAGTSANVSVRIRPISGQAGNVTLAARALPPGTPAPLTIDPALPLVFATAGAADIHQSLTLNLGSAFHLPFTFQLDATEGPTTVSAPLRVTPLPPATGSLQLGHAGSESSTSAVERRGPEVVPPTVPPTYTYHGRVDVARGELGFYLKARALGSLYTDFLPTALWLYNDTNVPVVLPAGALRMRVAGSYSLPATANAQAFAQLQVILASGTAAASPANSVTLVASVRHDNLVGRSTPVVTQSSSSASVAPPTVTVSTADRTALRAEFATPEFTLLPGGNARVSAALRGYDPVVAGSTLDFLSQPTRLCLTLPPGVRLLDNSLTPLNWTCP